MLPVSIRPPFPSEWKACRMLLPECFGNAHEPRLLMALDTSSAILGAISFQEDGEEFRKMRLRVIHTHWRLGIGSQLFKHVLQMAQIRQFQKIHAEADLVRELYAEPFLVANGFRKRYSLLKVEGSLILLHELFARLRERLTAHDRIPPAAKFVPLGDAPHAQLSQLYTEYIASEDHPGCIRPVFAHPRFNHSTVLVMGDTAAGLLLCELNEGSRVATVHARVVRPEYQLSGWANLMLMLLTVEKVRAVGAERVRFEVPQGNSDTLKLMNRCRGEIYAHPGWFVRNLSANER